MTMNPKMTMLISKLRKASRDKRLNLSTRLRAQEWLDLAQDAKVDYEELIEEAKMIGVRNPAFDGDMVGWLDDDFDDDEDETDKKKKP
jgi:hypothetical protein